MDEKVLILFQREEKPYDRIKFKFTSGQYHIHEIPSSYSLDEIRPHIAEYIDFAREMLEIDDSVELEYARALKEGDDESID